MNTLVLAAIDQNVVIPVAVALIAGFSTWFAQAWKIRRESNDAATRILQRYRDPLLQAAFELQSRLYNIATRHFFPTYLSGGTIAESTYARWNTLWLFGQYFGWVEILRREVQFLDLGSRAANRAVQRQLNEIAGAFATDSLGRDEVLTVFRGDQRAIGEFMIKERDTGTDKRPECLGYSEFIERLAPLLGENDPSPAGERLPVLAWGARFNQNLHDLVPRVASRKPPPRLVYIQRCLIDLLDLLDPDRLRYPNLSLRGKLPLRDGALEPSSADVIHFVWPWQTPWSALDAWAESRRLKCVATGNRERTYQGRRGPTGWRARFDVAYEDIWTTIEATIVRGQRGRYVDGSPRTRRACRDLNDLLRRFDRPLILTEKSVPSRVLARIWNRGAEGGGR